jgi:hypothetical protein
LVLFFSWGCIIGLEVRVYMEERQIILPGGEVEIKVLSPREHYERSTERFRREWLTNFRVPSKTIRQCREFADEWKKRGVGFYENRNQFNSNLIGEQSVDGKIGEWIAYWSFRSLHYVCSQPDMSVYDPTARNYAPDLIVRSQVGMEPPEEPFGVVVKSCPARTSYQFGTSWVFQNSDTEVHSAFLRKIVVFVWIGDGDGGVLAVTSLRDLHRLSLFAPTKRQALQSNKKAVYYDALKEHGFTACPFHVGLARALHEGMNDEIIKPL